MNILITYPLRYTGDFCEMAKERIPGLLVTGNIEQIVAMAKSGEVDKVCVLGSAYNADGYEIAEQIHQVDQSIPMLIWDSSKIPSENRPNEIYLEGMNFDTENYWYVFIKFFLGNLTHKEIHAYMN